MQRINTEIWQGREILSQYEFYNHEAKYTKNELKSLTWRSFGSQNEGQILEPKIDVDFVTHTPADSYLRNPILSDTYKCWLIWVNFIQLKLKVFQFLYGTEWVP